MAVPISLKKTIKGRYTSSYVNIAIKILQNGILGYLPTCMYFYIIKNQTQRFIVTGEMILTFKGDVNPGGGDDSTDIIVALGDNGFHYI